MATTKNNEDRQREATAYNPEVGEKTSLGEGVHNSGVTSADPAEKELIEKQGSLAKIKSQEKENDLTKADIPDSTNESHGQMGSGLRQDSN
jgi:hypothetical protein